MQLHSFDHSTSAHWSGLTASCMLTVGTNPITNTQNESTGAINRTELYNTELRLFMSQHLNHGISQ